MRELTRREFYILLIFPGLLLVGIYYFAFEGAAQPGIITPKNRPTLLQLRQSSAELRRSITSLDQSIAAAKRNPVLPLAEARAEVSQLNLKLDAEKRFAEANAHPGSMLPARWTSSAGRIEAIQLVESTFEDKGLIVVSRQTESESKKVVPKELEDFAAAVQNDGNHPVPEVWRINVVGSYGDMLLALDELGRRDTFVVPLSASMKIMPDDSHRRIWTIWLWI